MIPILIPAAGASSRMRGRDKLLEPVDHLPLLRRCALRALETGAKVTVTLPGPPHERYDALSGLEIATVTVPDAADGISASLRRGLAATTPKGPVMVLLPDLPDLTTAHLIRMREAVRAHPNHDAWRGVTAQGKGGHPVVLASTLVKQAQMLTGDTGFGPLLKDLNDRLCHVPLPDEVALTDLDTPEAWDTWRAQRDAAG